MFRHFKIKNTTGVNQSDVFTAKETSDTGFFNEFEHLFIALSLAVRNAATTGKTSSGKPKASTCINFFNLKLTGSTSRPLELLHLQLKRQQKEP